MSTEEKYKELKRKYATLKDAVKHFHDDYEKVKAELAAKKTECAEVEEQKKNLQKAYDNLTDEVSHIKSLRSSKPAGSTWENALTLIKTGGHSTSNTDNDDVSIFYNEVVSLKTQLETTAHEKEELLKQQRALQSEWDNQRFEYSAGIAELKERVLALEGILKDLQGSLDASEAKVASCTSDIATLNKALECSTAQVEKLEEALEVERQSQERHLALVDSQISNKLMFDLRRLSVLNVFNPYHQLHRYDWSVIRYGVDSLGDGLYSSLNDLFSAWQSALQFSQGSQIVTDRILQSHHASRKHSGDGITISSSHLDNKVSTSGHTGAEYTAGDHVVSSVSTESVDCGSASSPDDAHTFLISSFSEIGISTTDNSLQQSVEYSGNNRHLWLSLEFHRKKSLSILSELITLCKEMHRQSIIWQRGNRVRFVSLFKQLIRAQRLYFCLEEYLSPGDQNILGASSTRSNQHACRSLIRCLGGMCRTVSKLYNRWNCVFDCFEEFTVSELQDIFTVLSAEIEGSSVPSVSKKHSILAHGTTSAFYCRLDSDDSPLPRTLRSNNCLNALFGEVASTKHLHRLSKHLFLTIRELLEVVSKLKSVISYRLCCPKIVGKYFFPLSGGSSQMIQFSSSISSFEDNLSRFTDEIVSELLICMLNTRRIALTSVPSASSIFAENAKSGLDDAAVAPKSLEALGYVRNANCELKGSMVRIPLDDIECSLIMAEADRRQMLSCNERLRSINEELMVAKSRCESLECELREYKDVDRFDEVYSSEFDRLASRYRSHHQQMGINNAIRGSTNQVSLLSELHSVRDESSKKIKKLSAYVRYLVKSADMLEDSNRLLKQAVRQHVDHYTACKESENSIHLNYSEQIALMSEHISELNSSIVQAEYRLSEFSSASVTCPYCKTKCSLGSLMSDSYKGNCTSCCRCLIVRGD